MLKESTVRVLFNCEEKRCNISLLLAASNSPAGAIGTEGTGLTDRRTVVNGTSLIQSVWIIRHNSYIGQSQRPPASPIISEGTTSDSPTSSVDGVITDGESFDDDGRSSS